MKVCIIGGMPRAGTRQFTDILNKLDRVHIKGEVYRQSFNEACSLVSKANRDHAGRWSEPSYLKARLKTVLNIIAGISKGSNTPFAFDGLEIVGFKCPRIEIDKDTIDCLFRNDVERLYFFYCIRNIKDNYLSEKSNFSVSIERYVDRTVLSIRKLLEIHGDRVYKLQLLNLDDFISMKEKTLFIQNTIFQFLGDLDIEDNHCEELYKATTNRNATKNVGKQRLTTLTDREKEFFASHRGLNETLRLFEDKFNVRLLPESLLR